MPLVLLFGCQCFNSHLYTKFESILKDCFFAKSHILTPTVMKLFECFFLLVCDAFLQVFVVT